MSALGVAVLGLGVGEQHARTFATLRGCRLKWLYDIDVGRAHRLARSLRGASVAYSLAQILCDSDTQIVSIATYDHAHADQVVAALRAGKHVFVEKPMCTSSAELREIRLAWRTAGRPHLQSNLILRAAPIYRWLRKRIEGGALGRIYAIDGDYLYGRIHKIVSGWRGRARGYSVMCGGGIHMLDLLLWLSGEDPSRVTATGNRIVTRGTRFREKDYIAAAFGFPSGLIGRITANFGCVHRHQHVLRVFGSEATFLMDDQGARFYTKRDPGTRPSWPGFSGEPESKGELIPDFVRAIRSGRNSGPQAEREFRLIEACLAVDRAVNSGQLEPIE